MSIGNEPPATYPSLLILSGLPGSGKTTFANYLSRGLPNLAVIESDEVRRSLAAQPDYSPAESARVFGIVESRTRKALTNGRTTLVDATNLTPRDRRRFLSLARQLDVPVIAIRLVAPEATIRERLAKPRQGYSQANVEVYERMRTRPRPFTIPVLVVDSRFDLAPSLGAIKTLLRSGA